MSHVKKGEMRLYPAYKPALTAGTYKVQMDQSVSGQGKFETLNKYFNVTGPQLSLASSEILGAFPPNNAVGAYDNRLAHITLKRRTLPWERLSTTEKEGKPWLVLVVLAEAEANFNTNVKTEEFTNDLPSELKARFKFDANATMDLLEVPKKIVKEVFPLQSEVDKLVHVREVNLQDTELANGDDDGFMSVVLSNRLPRKDRSYGAYLISIEHRLDVLPTESTPTNDIGDPSPMDNFNFDLVKSASPSVAAVLHHNEAIFTDEIKTKSSETLAASRSRFSATLTAGSQGLVANNVSPQTWGAVRSVEFKKQQTQQKKQPVAGGSSKPFLYHDMNFAVLADMGLADTVKFPVLAHWSFTCTETGDFETLMQNLDIGLFGKTEKQNSTGLFADTQTATTVDTGHTLIDHLTRQGENTKSWYRGPLTPKQILRDADDPQKDHAPFHMADQARRLVEESREDISEAAAFECGRLLALSDVRFVQLLANWRKRNFAVKRQQNTLKVWASQRLGINTLDRKNLQAVQHILQVDVLRNIVNDEQLFKPEKLVPIHDALDRISSRSSNVIAEGLGISASEVNNILKQPASAASTDLSKVSVQEEILFDKLSANAEQSFSHLHKGLGQSLQYIVEGIGLESLNIDVESEINTLLDGTVDLLPFAPDIGGGITRPIDIGLSDDVLHHIDDVVTDIRPDLGSILISPTPTLVTDFVVAPITGITPFRRVNRP